ncbi:MAG TPA: hypothetical protein ENJ09_12010, partial [Planctomycetes bacterium]|nr:hypothetical protein [Planctomycetota bacterium]
MTHLPRSRRAIAGKNGYRRRSGGTLLLALALGSCSGNDSPATGTDTAAREHPISIQLHVHGSFSEGVGSIDSHSFEAQDVGVDAIWWSDHDFRISGYEHVAHFGFEDLSAPIDEDESWTSHLHRRLGDR